MTWRLEKSIMFQSNLEGLNFGMNCEWNSVSQKFGNKSGVENTFSILGLDLTEVMECWYRNQLHPVITINSSIHKSKTKKNLLL